MTDEFLDAAIDSELRAELGPLSRPELDRAAFTRSVIARLPAAAPRPQRPRLGIGLAAYWLLAGVVTVAILVRLTVTGALAAVPAGPIAAAVLLGASALAVLFWLGSYTLSPYRLGEMP